MLILILFTTVFLIGFLFGWLVASSHYEQRIMDDSFFTREEKEGLEGKTNPHLKHGKWKLQKDMTFKCSCGETVNDWNPLDKGLPEGDIWANDEHWEFRPKDIKRANKQRKEFNYPLIKDQKKKIKK